MPLRKTPLVTEQIYHVFNRGIDRRVTFTNKREYERAIQTVNYYRASKLPVRFSRFLSLPPQQREEIRAVLMHAQEVDVEILAYCLMPNHFHLLVKQKVDGGISRFLSQLQNSYTRYFNTKHKRGGPLFLKQFSAVRIETEEQLLHVSRYIHLNPYTSFIVKSIGDLASYPWSSFAAYCNEEVESFCNTEIILSSFKNKAEYKQFVYDQAGYQRQLGLIKHLLLEDA